MPPQTPVPPELIGRPFLLSTAVRAGVSPEVLRGQRFRPVVRSVYVSAATPDSLETRVDAVRLVLPDGAATSHHTAAMLRGLPVPPSPQIHLTVPPGSYGPRMAGVCTHRGAPAMVHHRGRLMSAPTENFLELAETLTLVDLVILGDAMVRRGLLTCDQLREAVRLTTRRRGVRMARRAAALVRAHVDSPMETRVRLLLVLGGLPEPVPNLVVRDGEGGWIGAVDLGYAAYLIAIEYHGDVHRSTPGQWRSDVAKAELLKRLGWQVIVLTSDDVYGRPGRTLQRVHEALVEAGHVGSTGIDPAWRTHFSRTAARSDQLAEVGHARAVS